MAFLPKRDIKVRASGGDNPPLQPPVAPPAGSVPKAPIPEGIEMHAQTLIHQAGSPELAKEAVDGAAERETIPDFREDHFGLRFGFASRPELLAASTPLTAADGTPWWTTAIAGNRWIVWNQQDMSASKTYSSLQEAAQQHLPYGCLISRSAQLGPWRPACRTLFGQGTMTIPLHTEPTSQLPGNYAIGDRIRVTRGTLAGQRGKLAWLSDLNNCVLTIDGLSEGVYVIVNHQSVEILEE